MPKNAFFLSKFSKKCPKTVFHCFFKNLHAAHIIGSKQCLGRAQKINLVDLKKKKVVNRQNFGNFVENRSAPALFENKTKPISNFCIPLENFKSI